MNSALASIGKNLLLVAVVIFSAANFFYRWLNWTELLWMQLLFGAIYIFLSCYEVLSLRHVSNKPDSSFPYFSFSIVTLRVLKASIFITFAMMLLTSGSRAKYLYVICLIIAATELIVLYIKYRKDLCFISIYANYVLFSGERTVKVFTSEIEIIEFRHEIFYFVTKSRKTYQVKMIHIKEKDRFFNVINEWINRNNAPVSKESKEKILNALN